MEEQYQQAIRYWTLAQPVVSAYVAAVVRDFRDRDDVLQAIWPRPFGSSSIAGQ